jgi:predicted DNA repair protein MutK
MFMVGGGILMHGVPALHHMVDSAAAMAASVPGAGGLLKALTPTVIDAVAGVLAGAIALVVVTIGTRLFKRKGAAAA